MSVVGAAGAFFLVVAVRRAGALAAAGFFVDDVLAAAVFLVGAFFAVVVLVFFAADALVAAGFRGVVAFASAAGVFLALVVARERGAARRGASLSVGFWRAGIVHHLRDCRRFGASGGSGARATLRMRR